MTSGTIFLPDSYGRSSKNGKITKASYYWSATANNRDRAPGLCFKKMLFLLPGERGAMHFLHSGRGLKVSRYVLSKNSVKRLVRNKINIKEREERNSLPHKPTRKRHTGNYVECAMNREQLCNQFMLIRNYTKDTDGLFARIIEKSSVLTILQYIKLNMH